MRKSIRSFIVMFVLVLVISQLSPVVLAKANIPSATSDFYVNDFANVFSADEETRLIDNAVALSNEHDGIQVVVTTVESLDGDTIENYALEMYNQYGIGKNDMGLLILLSTEDRQVRVEVGKAMEAYINDSKAGRFIDNYAIPSLKENKFNEGLINLQESLISEIVTNIENENASNVQSSDSKGNLDFLSILGNLLVICVVVVIIIFIVNLVRRIIAKSREKQKTIDTLTKQLEISKQNAIEIKSRANKNINTLQRTIDNLSKDKERLISKYQNLEDMYKTLKDRYERVQLLYPTADKDVTNMIEEETRQRDIALAQEVDLIIQKVIDLPASKDIVSELAEAKSSYSRLSQVQQSYVKSDINRLEQLYNESFNLKQEYDRMMEEKRRKELAFTALGSILAIISRISIGTARNLESLKEAKSIYNNLDSDSRPYFDKSVADKLDSLYIQAKRDKEAEEYRKRQEEAARRMNMQSNYSSLGINSHHSGFGGHSGGGGASRGF